MGFVIGNCVRTACFTQSIPGELMSENTQNSKITRASHTHADPNNAVGARASVFDGGEGDYIHNPLPL